MDQTLINNLIETNLKSTGMITSHSLGEHLPSGDNNHVTMFDQKLKLP